MDKKSVATLIQNRQGLVLAVSRIDNHSDLGLPGGKVDPGESYAEASIRETFEETGVTIHEQHFVFERQCGIYLAQVFRVDAWSGTPRSMEGALVQWIEPARLLTTECQFRDFNRSLFDTLGIIQP